MKDLTEIAKEDISKKFNELYEKVGEVRTYIYEKYGIRDREIIKHQEGEPFYGNITETEQAIYKIISGSKKK